MQDEKKKKPWEKAAAAKSGPWNKYATKVQAPQEQVQPEETSFGDRAGQVFLKPFEKMQQGASQMGSPKYPTSPIAGQLNTGIGAVQMAGWPIGLASEGVKSMPPWMRAIPGLTFAPEAVGVAEKGLGIAGDLVGGMTEGIAQYLLRNLPEEQRKELTDPARDIGSIGGQALVTGGIAKGLGAGLPKFGRTSTSIAKGNVALERAMPTISKELTRPLDRQRMAPYLSQEQRLSPVKKGNIEKGGTDPSILRQLAEEKFPKIKSRIWEDQQEIVNRNSDVPLSGGVEGVANSIESLRSVYTKNIDILADQSILSEAQKYREMGTITVGQATDMIRSINADLQKFYRASDESKAAAANAAKPIAEMERAARGLRDGVAKTLAQRGENVKFYKKLHDDYGSAIRMEVAAERNIVRAESPLPPLFTRGVHPSKYGAMSEIGQHTYGQFFTPDKLANRAMKRYAKTGLSPEMPPPPPVSPVRGLLPPPQTRLPFGGVDETRVTTGTYAQPEFRQLPPASTRFAQAENPPYGGQMRVSTGQIGNLIPPSARGQIIQQLGGPEKVTRFGPLRMLSDQDLITVAKEFGLYENAPISEAPASRGGSINVRGAANQEQIRRMKR